VSEENEYEVWARERRERGQPEVSFQVFQIMLEGRAIGKRRELAELRGEPWPPVPAKSVGGVPEPEKWEPAGHAEPLLSKSQKKQARRA
jgi:hypothetical protein